MHNFLFTIKAFIEYRLECLLCVFLRIKRRNDRLITEDDLKTIKVIESQSYPEDLQGYKDCESMSDFIHHCDCVGPEQIYLLSEDDWYIIVVKHLKYTEIKDFAASSGKCHDLFRVIGYLFENFSHDTVKMKCRDSTSYPLLMFMIKRGRVRLLQDKCIVMGEELFHEVTIKKAKRKKQPVNRFKGE